MKVFAFPIDGAEMTETSKFNVRTVKFGDGYEQRQPSGLRRVAREWECRRTGYKAAVEEIAAFFDGCGGVEAFKWDGRLVKVTEYKNRHLGGMVYQISWKFEEVMA